MELERLEIILEANLEKLEEQFARIKPIVDRTMGSLGMSSEKGISQVERNLDAEKGTNKLIKQLEKMNANFEKQMAMMEKTTQNSSENIGKGLGAGVRKGRSVASKEIDAMVNEINSKMGQAKAQQEKLAFLKTQRQSAASSGDRQGTIKIDEQIARAQASLTKYHDSAKALANSMKAEFQAVPQSLDAITTSMMQNEGRIETMRRKVRELQSTYETQRRPVMDDTGRQVSFRETDASSKTMDKIQQQSVQMNRLIRENDALQQAFATTEDRGSRLRVALENVNTELGESSSQTETAGSGMRNFGRIVEQSRGLFSRFGSLFSRQSKKIQSESKGMTSGINSFGIKIGRMIRHAFVFAVIYKGIRTVRKVLMDSLKTNDQFSASLNEIKVNLLTAFYPIYETILPAINALMNGIAKATAYIASFIATLFGTTFSAAKKGASSLNDQIAALNDTGSSADKTKEKVKKLQNALMGFDEINTLSMDTGEEDDSLDSGGPPNGIDFNIPDREIPAWVTNLAEMAKKIFADFFKPIQDSWNKHGQKVIDAWKYMLREVGGLVKAIGKSFMEVWTNGTGELFISNILILLADILSIIGDVAKAFKDAWNDNGRGTALIQSIFDMFNSMLELLHNIAQAFREAWNDGTGERIAGHLLEIFTNIFTSIGNIARKWSEAFQSDAGKSVINGILDIIEILLENVNKITKYFAEWTNEINLEPLVNSFDKLVKALKPLAENIGGAIAWLFKEVLLPLASFVIEDALPIFIDILAGALTVLNGVLELLKPVAKWLFDSFLKPIAKGIGDSLVKDLKKLNSILDTIGGWISSNKDIIDEFIQIGMDIVSGLFKGISGDIKNVKKFIKEKMFDPIVDAVKSLFGIHSPSTVFAEFGGFLIEGLIGGIGGMIGTAVESVSGLFGQIGDSVIGTSESIAKGTSEKWESVKNSVTDAVGIAGKSVSEKWDSISKGTEGTWENVKKKTTDTWDNASKKVTEKATEIHKNANEKFTNLRTNTGILWDAIGSATSTKWESVRSSVTTKANTAKDNAIASWRNMDTGIGNFMNGIKTNTSKGFDTVSGWASGLGGKIASGLRGGLTAVGNAAKSLGNTLLSPISGAVNGVIKGINWVLGKVGSGTKIGEWTVPWLEKGTNNHKGGLAVVNDAKGSTFREAIRLPNGKEFIPTGRNVMLNLPKGSKVLNAASTAKQYGSIPQYANGIGDWFSEKWQGAKNLVGDVWDYVSNPGEILKTGISMFTNLNGAIEPALSIAKGSISTMASGAVTFIKKAFDEGTEAPSGGGSVERWRPVIKKALTMNALPANEIYTSAWLRQVQSESGGNEKAVQGGYTDVNTLSGDLAKGLLQTISATFNAYKFPGKGNIFNGFHNALAAINYAKNRYGATSMLGVIGHGHGYENGGLVDKEGEYRLAEGNKAEMIIPLTRKTRALDLIDQALDYMGVDMSSLTMPEIFRSDSFSTSSFSSQSEQPFDGESAMASMANNISESIIGALSVALSGFGSVSQASTGDIIIQIGNKEFGRFTIAEINKAQRQAGVTLLEI